MRGGHIVPRPPDHLLERLEIGHPQTAGDAPMDVGMDGCRFGRAELVVDIDLEDTLAVTAPPGGPQPSRSVPARRGAAPARGQAATSRSRWESRQSPRSPCTTILRARGVPAPRENPRAASRASVARAPPSAVASTAPRDQDLRRADRPRSRQSTTSASGRRLAGTARTTYC